MTEYLTDREWHLSVMAGPLSADWLPALRLFRGSWNIREGASLAESVWSASRAPNRYKVLRGRGTGWSERAGRGAMASPPARRGLWPR